MIDSNVSFACLAEPATSALISGRTTNGIAPEVANPGTASTHVYIVLRYIYIYKGCGEPSIRQLAVPRLAYVRYRSFRLPCESDRESMPLR
jgi:hypothetical protein